MSRTVKYNQESWNDILHGGLIQEKVLSLSLLVTSVSHKPSLFVCLLICPTENQKLTCEKLQPNSEKCKLEERITQ